MKAILEGALSDYSTAGGDIQQNDFKGAQPLGQRKLFFD